MPPPRTGPHAGRRLGDFELIREIGRGGMGVVYEARQVSLNRKVALKILSAGLGLTGNAVTRFQREAEAAARLHHTNIVPVYSTGEEDGTHYYAMEMIDGPSLDRVLARHLIDGGKPASVDAPSPMPPDLLATGDHVPGSSAAGPDPEAITSSLGSGVGYFDAVARMIADVADALGHAHKNEVIHRDIKPSNLLLSSEGRLSVNDFGLARMLEQPGMTMTGEFVGTPAYMSPEQIASGRTPVDHRTDIYSLGATLYEMLTLQRPFPGDRRDQVLGQILHKDPKPPRKVNRRVPVDLETVCLKAMEKDPDRRYQTAGRMAEDLRRFVSRFAISARRAGPATLLRKWVSRHPGLASGLTVALLASGVAASLAFRVHGVEKRRLSDQRRMEGELQHERRQAAVDKAILEAMSGDAPAALEAIAAAERVGAELGRLNMLRGLVEHHLGRTKEALVYLQQAERQMPESVAVKALLAAAYSDDGQYQRFDEMYAILEHLDPKTAEDHLFLGLSMAESDPVLALRILDGASARSRQAPVARLARAMAQHLLAQNTGRVEDAEQALDDLLKVDLPDNPFLMTTRIRIQLVAAHNYGPNDPRRDAAMQRAALDVELLGAYRDNTSGVVGRCFYYFVRGDDEALIEEVRHARARGVENHYATDFDVCALYGRKQYGDALRIRAPKKDSGFETWQLIDQGIVLVAIPGRMEEAERAFTRAIEICKGGTTLGYVTAYLQMLGPEHRERARRAAADIRERSSHLIPDARNRWYHDLLAFHAELLDAEGLLKKAGESRFNQCEAFFYIGLRNLANGRRKEAKKCFTRSAESGVFIWSECKWSRAFLARIDDPEWLPWLPADR